MSSDFRLRRPNAFFYTNAIACANTTTDQAGKSAFIGNKCGRASKVLMLDTATSQSYATPRRIILRTIPASQHMGTAFHRLAAPRSHEPPRVNGEATTRILNIREHTMHLGARLVRIMLFSQGYSSICCTHTRHTENVEDRSKIDALFAHNA